MRLTTDSLIDPCVRVRAGFAVVSSPPHRAAQFNAPAYPARARGARTREARDGGKGPLKRSIYEGPNKQEV
jgi:hypothetical protein